MSDVFLDNQTVTAAALNQIAIDLGKSAFSTFTDGTEFSVDKLNEITKNLASAGIVAGDTNQCKPVLADGQISIDTGLCIFASGAKKRIETKQYLTPTADTKQYVYLINDTGLNTISLNISTDSPAGIANADYVMLAVYNADNTLTDQRKFSTAKVSIPSANQSQVYSSGLLRFWSSENYENRYYIGDYGKPFQYVLSLYYSGEDRGNWAKIGKNGERGEDLRIGDPYSSDYYIQVEQEGTALYYRKDMGGRGGSQSSFKILLI